MDMCLNVWYRLDLRGKRRAEGPTCEVGMFVVSWWGRLVKALL